MCVLPPPDIVLFVQTRERCSFCARSELGVRKSCKLGGPLGGAVGLSSFGRLYCTSHEIEIEIEFQFRVRQRNRKSKSKIRCRIANHESIESTEIDKLVTNLRTSIFDWLSNRQSKSGLTIENANRKYDWHVDRMSDRQS